MMKLDLIQLLTSAAAASIAISGAASPAAAEEGPYGRMIVFGDSISDSGTYVDKAPEGAGRFTTNPDPVWVEVMAKSYGLPLSSAVDGGLNFAEGGARVTQPRDGAPGDLSRTPISVQADRFLQKDGFRPDDLVTVQGGGNDVFATQANGLDFTPADLKVLETAAGDLADLLGRLEGAGAQWLVTTSVPQFEVYNSYYRDAIAASGVNLLYFDAAALIDEIEADPATYGLTNIIDPACEGTAVQSFRCLPENLVTPDANKTHLYADRVHFTGIVHQMHAEAVLATINSVHQLNAAVQLLDAAQPASAAWLGAPAGRGLGMVGSVRGSRLKVDGFPSAEADVSGLSLGLSGVRGRNAGGIGFSYDQGEGDAGSGTRFGWDSLGVQAFYEHRAGPFHVRLEGGWSALRNVRLDRQFAMGPATREEQGETEGEAASAKLALGRQFVTGNLSIEPSVSLGWRKLSLDGWSEEDPQSTSISVADIEEEVTELGLGVTVKPVDPGKWAPFGSAGLFRTVAGQAAPISITPSGAPVAFTAPEFDRDRYRSEVEVGVKGPIGRGAQVSLSGRWTPTGAAETNELRLSLKHAF
jgi:outer membrane lipase/esterase